jgi:phosphate transport system substrate-binding protein
MRSVLGLILFLAAFLASCSRISVSRQSSSPSPLLLKGAISSASSTPYRRWFSQLAADQDLYSDLQVTSSGEALEKLLAKSVDFASTDSPPSPAQMKRGLLAFPVTASSVSIAYNYPACQLALSLSQVAAVLQGQITNYSELGCDNQPIQVYYRGGSSGTTATLSNALASSSVEWRQKYGSSMTIVLKGGIPVKGGSEMLQRLSTTKGAFGYVDTSFVSSPLQSARLKNAERFYTPDYTQSELALSYLKLDSALLGKLSQPLKGYPIVGLNWLVVRRDMPPATSSLLQKSLEFIYDKRGQEDAELLGYLRLPSLIRQRALQQLKALP